MTSPLRSPGGGERHHHQPPRTLYQVLFVCVATLLYSTFVFHVRQPRTIAHLVEHVVNEQQQQQQAMPVLKRRQLYHAVESDHESRRSFPRVRLLSKVHELAKTLSALVKPSSTPEVDETTPAESNDDAPLPALKRRKLQKFASDETPLPPLKRQKLHSGESRLRDLE